MNIEQVANNMFNLTGVPISIYNKEENPVSFNIYTIPSKLNEIVEGNKNQMILNTLDEKVYRLQDFSQLSYFSFKVLDNIIIVGPYLEKEVNNSIVHSLTGRLRLINEDIKLVDSFYLSLKVLNNEEIDFIYNLFSNIIECKYNPASFTTIQAKQIKTSKKASFDNLFVELEYVKNNYIIEDEFLKVVEGGDIIGAENFPTKEIMKQLPKRALNDSLRNAKTRLTILNTLCNRAAIRGGIDVQLGHQISTNYGIMIESMSSILDSDILTKEIIKAYATAVNNYSLKGYSKLIRQAVLNIRRNITYKYSLDELANDLFVTKEHLSRAFKKDTGMTLSKYVGYTKVMEATKLLALEEYSISDISNTLGFTNNTYFSKVFKEHMGVSPVNYRKSLTNKKPL